MVRAFGFSLGTAARMEETVNIHIDSKGKPTIKLNQYEARSLERVMNLLSMVASFDQTLSAQTALEKLVVFKATYIPPEPPAAPEEAQEATGEPEQPKEASEQAEAAPGPEKSAEEPQKRNSKAPSRQKQPAGPAAEDDKDGPLPF